MKNLSFTYKSQIIIDKEHHDIILHNIELANLARIKIMLIILFTIQIMFIIFNDLPYYSNPTSHVIWSDFGYFVVHLFLLSTSVIGFIIVNKLIKSDTGKWKHVYSYLTPAILVIYLILISLINALDMVHIKNISSVFNANLLICGGVFMINFPKNLCLYAVPFLSYIGTYIYLSFETDVLFANFINDSIFFLALIIISTLMYNYQYEIISKNIILDKTNNQLNYISNRDPLTGLLNRRAFMEHMENNKMESATIVLIDIDFFKDVNDTYGHPIGDLVLQKISLILIKCINEEGLSVRWGGEEFLLFLYNTSMEEAYIFMETTRKAIQELTIQVKEYKIQITASFGIATLNNESDISFYTAYKEADIALYQAKNQGRNCVVKGYCEKNAVN